MNRKHVLMLPLFLTLWTLWSCAMEGGTRGSGISAAVEGNVAGIQMAAPDGAPDGAAEGAAAQTARAGIRVAIEGTDAQDQTDVNGDFAVRGEFEGQLTLIFQLPESQATARIAINVPAGGTLTLHDIELDLQHDEASAAALDVEFQGVVTAANCEDRTLTLVSARHAASDVDLYTLHLDTSSVQDVQGNPVACEDFKGGEQLSIHGKVNADGTFGDAAVREEE